MDDKMIIEPSKEFINAIEKEKARLLSRAKEMDTYEEGCHLLKASLEEYEVTLKARKYPWHIRKPISALLHEDIKQLKAEALKRLIAEDKTHPDCR